nr:PREDICTED: uncharacterized protein LOC106489916 [Apteryx mantelli mantelli]
MFHPVGSSGVQKNSYSPVILHVRPVTKMLTCVLHVQKENFLVMIPVSLNALNKLLAMWKAESVRCAWTIVRCAPTPGTVRSVSLDKTSHSFSTKADAFRNALRDILMILGLARNAVDPVRHAWEVPPNANPVKVLCFWSSGNVNIPVRRSILLLKESANTALQCARSAFTIKCAKIPPVLKHAHMDIMLTVMRDNVPHATAPVTLALENTAHSASPANQAGTGKEKDV